MFFIDFQDTLPRQEELIRDVIQWFDENFLSEYIYDITVEMSHLDVYALMHVPGDLDVPREFHIEIEKNQSDEEMIKTVLHEMVHIEDYIKGRLTEKDCERFWNGVSYEDEDPENQPWEIRAMELENVYFDQYSSTRFSVCQAL